MLRKTTFLGERGKGKGIHRSITTHVLCTLHNVGSGRVGASGSALRANTMQMSSVLTTRPNLQVSPQKQPPFCLLLLPMLVLRPSTSTNTWALRLVHTSPQEEGKRRDQRTADSSLKKSKGQRQDACTAVAVAMYTHIHTYACTARQKEQANEGTNERTPNQQRYEASEAILGHCTPTPECL